MERQRFSVLDIETRDDKRIIISNPVFGLAAPRKPERISAIAPLYSLQTGQKIEINTANIKSIAPFQGTLAEAATINQSYLSGPQRPNTEYTDKDSLELNQQYRIILPRRSDEVVWIRAFHRDRELVEVEHCSDNRIEAFATELTTWEKL